MPEAQPPAAAPAKRSFGPCVQHPETASTRTCDRCGAPMCPVCTFEFPGRLYFCPTCIASPVTAVSGKRAGLAIGGIIAACTSIAFMAAMMMGMMQFASEATAGIAYSVLVLLPAAVGLALSYSAMDRNQGNNNLLWSASILASLQLGLVMAMILYGLFSS